MNNYKTTSHAKHLLQYHAILVCKYRLKLFQNNKFDKLIKYLIQSCCDNSNWLLHYIESDKDHIHLLIETKPNTNISQAVNKLKSYTTYHAWKQYNEYLSKFLWSTKSIWTRGYFIATVGNVSADTVAEYIKNQGGDSHATTSES